MLVLNVAVADTREQAIAQVRERARRVWRFLAPYGWGRATTVRTAGPAGGGFVPTLEDSISQGPWAVGTGPTLPSRSRRWTTCSG